MKRSDVVRSVLLEKGFTEEHISDLLAEADLMGAKGDKEIHESKIAEARELFSKHLRRAEALKALIEKEVKTYDDCIHIAMLACGDSVEDVDAAMVSANQVLPAVGLSKVDNWMERVQEFINLRLAAKALPPAIVREWKADVMSQVQNAQRNN